MKRITDLAVAILFAVSSTAIFAEDIGIVVRENGINRGSIYWWDDDSLLVAGVHSKHPPKDNSGWRLLRYKVSDKSVTDMGQVGALCVSDGYLRISRLSADSFGKAASDWKFVLYSGSIDKLVEDPPRPVSPPSTNPPSFNALSNCKFPDELPVPAWLESAKKSGRVFRPLKLEHGWLEMAYARRPDGSFNYALGMHPIRVYPPDDQGHGKPVLGLEQIDLGPIQTYYAFKGAYLVYERGVYSSTTGFVRSWWLYPDGHVEPALQYDRALRRGDTLWVEDQIIPTRMGYLQIHERSYSRMPSANAMTGLHLFEPKGSFKKLAGGRIEPTSLAVSPDGCRVAFGADERYVDGAAQYLLKLIDVCKE